MNRISKKDIDEILKQISDAITSGDMTLANELSTLIGYIPSNVLDKIYCPIDPEIKQSFHKCLSIQIEGIIDSSLEAATLYSNVVEIVSEVETAQLSSLEANRLLKPLIKYVIYRPGLGEYRSKLLGLLKPYMSNQSSSQTSSQPFNQSSSRSCSQNNNENFYFDANVILRDRKKFNRYQSNSEIYPEVMTLLEKNIERYGSELAFMESTDLSEKDFEKFIEANRRYMIKIWYDDLQYQRVFENKEDWKEFEKRLNVWLSKTNEEKVCYCSEKSCDFPVHME